MPLFYFKIVKCNEDLERYVEYFSRSHTTCNIF